MVLMINYQKGQCIYKWVYFILKSILWNYFFLTNITNNNLPLKINCESIAKTFVIKIDTDFNLNVLLKLFFSFSKKIIFFSQILTNNDLPLKIYCGNIVIVFPSFFSSLFSLPHVPLLIFFFSFFLLFFPITSSKLQNVPSSFSFSFFP